MKKLLFGAVLAALVSAAPAAYAAVGDVAGEIYSTDILAVVNGEPMASYNIGGRTAVIAEELDTGGYGFRHSYNDAERTLYIESGSNTNVGDVSVERGKVGEVVGNIYDTDIKVICNGHEVPGYNIGGKTAVVIEDLGTPDGTSANEQYGYTKYLCNFTWDNDTRTVTLDSFRGNYRYDSFLHYITYRQNENIITASYSPDNMYADGMEKTFDQEKYRDRFYELEPVYLELDGEMTQVGLMYMYPSGEDVLSWENIDYDKLNFLTAPLKPDELIPYAETIERFGNTEEYEIIDRCETENYTCMLVRFKKEAGDGDIHLVSVRKEGGYVTMGIISSENYSEYGLEKTGTDTISFNYGPTAAPHGKLVTISTSYDLNMYIY